MIPTSPSALVEVGDSGKAESGSQDEGDDEGEFERWYCPCREQQETLPACVYLFPVCGACVS